MKKLPIILIAWLAIDVGFVLGAWWHSIHTASVEADAPRGQPESRSSHRPLGAHNPKEIA